MAKQMCKNCVLDESFPSIRFNEEGLCQYCTSNKKIDHDKIRLDVETFLRQSKNTSGKYDVALAFSGGKDSSYTLKYFVENFDLRVIAITIDNGFIAERAYKNCQIVTSNLGVDHMFFKPSSKKMFNLYKDSTTKDVHSKTALMRASSICNSCIQVINTTILNFCISYEIPIIAGGYIGGQVPSETGFMEQNLDMTYQMREAFLKEKRTTINNDALQLLKLHKSDKSITVINPMVYLKLSEEKIIEELLPLGWEKPKDTGKASTNCLLNDYAIFRHQNKMGYHPYVFEIANSVRQGSMTREHALKVIEQDLSTTDFKEIEKKLGLIT
jgi:tRNA(Ile)-lysidine synthase TilS/MesJ